MKWTAPKISEEIRRHVARPGCFSMTNTYIKGSPWECDVLRVLKSGYWHEYEIKLSVADYRADFRKRISSWKSDSPKKHDLYKSDDELLRSRLLGHAAYKGVFPKPATFHFVTPAGLLDGVDIPDHCGLIEVRESIRKIEVVTVTRKAPRLKKPTKLSYGQLFNLCLKK